MVQACGLMRPMVRWLAGMELNNNVMRYRKPGMKQISLVLTAVLFASCSLPRKFLLAIKQDDNRTYFEFSMHRYNGLLGLRLWKTDTKELLWDMNLNYYREERLEYGNVPKFFLSFNGAQQRATQNFPADNQKPRAFQPNSRFMVDIDLIYDTSSTSRMFSFKTDADGRIVSVSPEGH